MTPEELAALHAACFHDAPMSVDQARKMLAIPTMCLLVAQDAFLLASVVPPEAEISDVGVHPRARRTGQARRLIETLQQQVDKIFLEVAATNTRAIALYESTGFVVTGRRPGYYRSGQKPVDGLSMTWIAAGEVTGKSQESVDPTAR